MGRARIVPGVVPGPAPGVAGGSGGVVVAGVVVAGVVAGIVAAAIVGVALRDRGSPGERPATDDGSVAVSAVPGTGPTARGGSVATSATAPDPVAIAQIEGGPREDVPSALVDPDHPDFPEPLVDLADIRPGGPPPDGIPPIDEPRFERASDVDWVEDVEPVLLVEIDGDARAYPVQIMTWHEIVNDTFGDVPVTVSYCPLCNSAIVYVRRAAGRTLDFGTSGRLYRSSLVMYDRQTESLWSHFVGRAVVGTLTGAELETLPVSTVAWSTFRAAHPDGLVLSRDTGFDRNYGRNPYPGYDDVNGTPFLFEDEPDGRLPAQTRVVAVRGDDETVAVPLDDLAATGVVETSVDGEPIVVLHAPGTASALDTTAIAEGRDVGTVGVFRPVAAGTAVDLRPLGDGTFTDAESGTTFDVLGAAVAGELQGVQLEPVEHLDTFWFAIAAFEPDTRIVDR